MTVANGLPSTWLALRLGDVIDYGSTIKAEPEEIAPETWVLELEDVEKDSSRITQRLTFAQRQSKSTKNRFNAGDVLYGKLRPYLNKVVFAKEAGVCTTEIVPLKPNAAVDGRYLFHWVKHPEFLRYVIDESHGVNMPRLGTETGRKAPFVLAPFAEQRRIADKLDTVLARVDAVNERLARVAPLLKRLRQSVLTAATSGRLTEDWRSCKSVEEDWRVTTLGDYVENHDGRRVPIAETLRTERRGAYPYYGASGVIDTIDGFTHDGKFLLIGEDGANLVTRSKPIAFIAEGKFWVNNHAHVLKCKNSAPEEYLAYYINAIDLTPYVSGSAQPKLSQKNMNTIPVLVPPIQEQTEIVRRVELLFAYADRLEARLRSAQTAANRLTPALLAKAFRGELVPQDPNDEPAAELLRRLAASAPATPKKRGRAAQAQ